MFPNPDENIINFLHKLVVIYKNILDTESDLPEGPDKKYIETKSIKSGHLL